jgi:ribulose-5-phosphate 4-epimerase/fuculose-1-phosphate aldolase
MTEAGELRERIAQACRVLGRLDLAKGLTGHVSARLPGDRLLIRARGPGELGVRYTTAEQILECDFEGRLLSGGEGLATPLEIFIHTAVYRANPAVQAVVHVHPPTVVLFTICEKPLLPLYGAYDPFGAAIALDGVPTYPRSVLIRTPELGAELAAAMGSSPVCMMRGHGITTAGGSIEEAALYAIHLNELALMNYQAHLLGNPKPIPAEDQATFRSMARGSAAGARGVPALWRYYVAVTEA